MLAVALLNWNGREDTLACLESLERSDFRDFRICVADNASTDGSAAAFRAWLATRRPGRGDLVLETGGNLGFAGGYNPLLREILADPLHDMVLVLNNDTVVAGDCLGTLVRRGRELGGLWLVGAGVRGPWGQEFGGVVDHRLGATRTLRREEEWRAAAGRHRYLPGAALLMPAALPARIGLFVEDFFLYYEDADFSLRAAEAGAVLHLCPEAIVVHKEGSSIGSSSRPDRRAKSLLAEYHGLRSRLIFMRRRFPRNLLLARLACAGVLVRRAWRLQPRAAATVLRAFLDDLAGRPLPRPSP